MGVVIVAIVLGWKGVARRVRVRKNKWYSLQDVKSESPANRVSLISWWVTRSIYRQVSALTGNSCVSARFSSCRAPLRPKIGGGLHKAVTNTDVQYSEADQGTRLQKQVNGSR